MIRSPPQQHLLPQQACRPRVVIIFPSQTYTEVITFSETRTVAHLLRLQPLSGEIGCSCRLHRLLRANIMIWLICKVSAAAQTILTDSPCCLPLQNCRPFAKDRTTYCEEAITQAAIDMPEVESFKLQLAYNNPHPFFIYLLKTSTL